MSDTHTDSIDSVAASLLRSFVERVETIEQQIKDIDCRKEVYDEAKANGLDVKIMKKIIAMRRKDPNERAEEETILELYCRALGMEA